MRLCLFTHFCLRIWYRDCIRIPSIPTYTRNAPLDCMEELSDFSSSEFPLVWTPRPVKRELSNPLNEGQCRPRTVWSCWPFDERARVPPTEKVCYPSGKHCRGCSMPVVSCILRCDAVPFRFCVVWYFIFDSWCNQQETCARRAWKQRAVPFPLSLSGNF